jgi:hypothetical protein
MAVPEGRCLIRAPEGSARVSRLREKLGTGLGVACLAVSVVLTASALAIAGDDSVDEGPSIDYCPTTDQVEAHWEQYGFDYKPTVPCGENGEELESVGTVTTTDAEAIAEDRALLESARLGEDVDGDPRTMEIVLPDGSGGTVFISTTDPDHYRNMTPSEFAEEIYGER